MPTETVYGLAADAFNPKACARIFAVKGRPANDPLIVHVASLSQAREVAEVSPAAAKLMRAFWPGPLTLVLPKKPAVPDVVTSGLPSVAVRMPAHPLLRRLLAKTGRPLAAPSANSFGYVSPTTPQHVEEGLGTRIAAILDGGPCAIGLESTIVDLRSGGAPRVLRPGKITARQIAKVLGRRVKSGEEGSAGRRGAAGRGRRVGAAMRSEGPSGAILAPGMMARHYSPRTPVVLHRRIGMGAPMGAPEEAWVFLKAPPAARRGPNVFWWDQEGDLSGVARNLFALLRRLDRGRWKAIHAELARGGDWSPAINDRLQRAAAYGTA